MRFLPALARGLWLLALPALAGCVMFERAPTALRCDTDLAGRWLPLSGSGEALPLDRDDYAEVDGQCRVSLMDAAGTPPRSHFSARGFELDGQRYLALQPADMRELFNDRKPAAPTALPAGSVLLLKYRIDGDVLELALPSMSYAAEQLQRGTLKAREADTMVYLVEGSAAVLRQTLAAHPDLFERFDPASRNLRMRRAATATGAAP